MKHNLSQYTIQNKNWTYVLGYTGKSCEVQIEFCDENSCSNNAICVVEDGARVCYCVPDYHGERCELQYDECLLGPR